jgi:hypothetical protein
MTNFGDMKFSVEALSGGNSTVKLDDIGMPSILVPFPKLKYSDVLDGGTQDTLPAFLVDGQEKSVVYMSKFQNIVMKDRAYSLPMEDPATYVNFDRALTVCRNKGAGWHLATNALWAAIALWCKKNGTQPHGNNNYGQEYSATYEKGVPSTALDSSGRVLRTQTGSGPVSWYHNYNISGIADLNGNIWEWVSGLRLVDGEIQIIPYGNAMKLDSNMGATSTEWKAILQDGTIVDPGTANTLKWDYKVATPTAGTTQIQLIAGDLVNKQADDTAYGNDKYGNLKAATGVTAPMLLKALGLFPDAALADYNSVGNFFFRNNGERLPDRGGRWSNGSSAGVFALYLDYPRSNSSSDLGFRSAFYE